MGGPYESKGSGIDITSVEYWIACLSGDLFEEFELASDDECDFAKDGLPYLLQVSLRIAAGVRKT